MDTIQYTKADQDWLEAHADNSQGPWKCRSTGEVIQFKSFALQVVDSATNQQYKDTIAHLYCPKCPRPEPALDSEVKKEELIDFVLAY